MFLATWYDFPLPQCYTLNLAYPVPGLPWTVSLTPNLLARSPLTTQLGPWNVLSPTTNPFIPFPTEPTATVCYPRQTNSLLLWRGFRIERTPHPTPEFDMFPKAEYLDPTLLWIAGWPFPVPLFHELGGLISFFKLWTMFLRWLPNPQIWTNPTYKSNARRCGSPDLFEIQLEPELLLLNAAIHLSGSTSVLIPHPRSNIM